MISGKWSGRLPSQILQRLIRIDNNSTRPGPRTLVLRATLPGEFSLSRLLSKQIMLPSEKSRNVSSCLCLLFIQALCLWRGGPAASHPVDTQPVCCAQLRDALKRYCGFTSTGKLQLKMCLFTTLFFFFFCCHSTPKMTEYQWYQSQARSC